MKEDELRALDAMIDKVLAYKPKPRKKTQPKKRRTKKKSKPRS